MFPEYRDLISKLKTSDHHFQRLFDKHNELDERIQRMEQGIEPGTHEQIETLKKEKLLLKDQLYDLLRKASAATT
ncbi:MAG: YdcH family protein [Tepidimonas sp.]|uniref:YdcH family protein n=1 Tax=Tepidimonas sp. TaxID=2002775 RepID=UPI00298EDA4E|nr:YdcH family protein [Tepidimonas sp.]MCS6811936.1 YdcH family protein [Tepidimonas sp.]MDW8337329.1 YdcH family protein [Tepidimonas sp.]